MFLRLQAPSGERPIVLLERSSPSSDLTVCSFEEKVTMAAVIFDYQNEGPIKMLYEHPDGVTVPAVFISHSAGEALLHAMVEQNARPLTVLSPPPPPAPGSAAARFELVSFTTGYALLLLCTLPVALYNAMALLKRRRALESLLRVVTADPQLKAKLEAHEDLAEHLPFPQPTQHPGFHPGSQGRCFRVHRFLGLALSIYVAQMMLLWALEPPNVVAEGDTTVSAAALFGVNEVLSALSVAAFLVLLHRCVMACARFFCGGGDREEIVQPEAPRVDAEAQASEFPKHNGLPSVKAAVFAHPRQAVVASATLAEPLVVTARVPAHDVKVASLAK